jgi:hypothetical protein
MTTNKQRIRISSAVLLSAFALLLPSCGSSRKPVYPVTGHVFLKHKPVAGATVILHPVNAESGDVAKPAGKVGEQGEFQLTTYSRGDGAPEGEYVMTVEWRAPKRSPVDAYAIDRLQGRFSDPKTSTLRVRVDRQTAELQPIDLAARR